MWSDVARWIAPTRRRWKVVSQQIDAWTHARQDSAAAARRRYACAWVAVRQTSDHMCGPSFAVASGGGGGGGTQRRRRRGSGEAHNHPALPPRCTGQGRALGKGLGCLRVLRERVRSCVRCVAMSNDRFDFIAKTDQSPHAILIGLFPFLFTRREQFPADRTKAPPRPSVG